MSEPPINIPDMSLPIQLARLHDLEQRINAMQRQVTHAIERVSPADTAGLAQLRDERDYLAASEARLQRELDAANAALEREREANAVLYQTIEQLSREHDIQAQRAYVLITELEAQQRATEAMLRQMDSLQQHQDSAVAHLDSNAEAIANLRNRIEVLRQGHEAEVAARDQLIARYEAQLATQREVISRLRELRPLLDRLDNLEDEASTHDQSFSANDQAAALLSDVSIVSSPPVERETGLPAQAAPSNEERPPNHNEQLVARAISYLQTRSSTTHRELKEELGLSSPQASQLLHTMQERDLIGPRRADGRYYALGRSRTATHLHALGQPPTHLSQTQETEFKPYLLNPRP